MQENKPEFTGFNELAASVRFHSEQNAAAECPVACEPPTAWLTPDEIDTLLTSCADDPDVLRATLVALVFLTGLDPELLLTCRWGGEPVEVFVGDDSDPLSITAPIAALLEALWLDHFADRYVFAEILQPDAFIELHAVLTRVTENAGLQGLTFADLQANHLYVALFDAIFNA